MEGFIVRRPKEPLAEGESGDDATAVPGIDAGEARGWARALAGGVLIAALIGIFVIGHNHAGGDNLSAVQITQVWVEAIAEMVLALGIAGGVFLITADRWL